MVDALVSNTNDFGRAGSIPALGTSHLIILAVMVTVGIFLFRGSLSFWKQAYTSLL